MKRILNERAAQTAAAVMEAVCYLLVGFAGLCLVLACLGRQTFALRVGGEYYERAIYAEEKPGEANYLLVHSPDDVRVTANAAGEVELATHIGLTLMYAAEVLPLLFAYWFLGRLFANVGRGQIFVEENARYLLAYGLIQFATSLLAPLVKLFLQWITNQLAGSQIALSAGGNLLNGLVPGIACLVAAYILHHGIALQDEVDHTL
ncbi:MAG TPA: DUF2975 domain-containing protein [Candidatus Faecousia intestinigallinarum]|nr:DUF2975 domain-containing protein [Candidatus Faecousia intestinigallinarum]